MKTRKYLFVKMIFLFSMLLLHYCFPVELFASINGKITGVITDRTTGDVLPGANCIILGTALGSASDLNGEYRILNIPPGSYTLKIMYIGYVTLELPVQVKADATVNRNISLKSTVLDINQDVVVTAQREGQVAAINQQLTADAIKNVVAAERIQEVPDANAAESVSRLPGISLIRNAGEGAKVVVRGLSPKYSKITINGISIPSTDSGNRSSDLSMISPENLSGIEVFKALTPDMEGDAIGGVVNLQLAKAKEKPEHFIRFYGAYNSQEKDWRQYKTAAKWSQRILHNSIGVQASVNSEYRNRSSDYLSASYVLSQPKEDGTTPLRLDGAKIGDREEYRQRFGGNLILDYDIGNWSFMFSNFYNRTNRDVRNRETGFEGTNMNIRSFISNPEAKIDLITNVLDGKGMLKGMEVDWTLSHSFTESNWLHDNRLDFLQDDAVLPIVDFDTVHPADYLKNTIPDSTGSMSGAEYGDNIVKERSYVAGINLKFPYQISHNIAGELKFGARYRSNDRFRDTNGGDWWVYLDLKTFPITDFFDDDYDPGEFLGGQSNIGIVLDPTLTNSFFEKYRSNYTLNKFKSGTNYETLDQISATYLMTKLNIGQAITFIPGVRYEQFNGDYRGYLKLSTGHGTGLMEPRERQINQKNWLPMFHLKVKPAQWFDVRLAVTKSISRPDFISMVPYLHSSLNQLTSGVSQGNPDLKPARSWNYDAYVSFYHQILGLFTFGYFYKEIEDVAIWTTRYIESQEKAASLGLPPTFYKDLTYVGRQVGRPENCPESTVKGFEIDMQTNFGYLPGYLKGFVINVNYSRIWSQTHFPFFKVETILDYTKFPPIQKQYITGTRPGRVPGQADHLANLSLGYDVGGFSARVSMTYQGKSLAGAYTQKEKDTWNKAFTRWDFSLRQRLNENLSLFMNGVNLTDQSEEAYLGMDPRPSSLQFYGTMYDLGIQYAF